MSRRKDISNDLRKSSVAAHQSDNSKNYIVRKINYKWKTFDTVVNLPKSEPSSKITPKPDCVMFREITKSQRATSQTLQVTVKVHDRTMQEKNEKVWFVWKVYQRKPLFIKKNLAAQLKLHLNKPQDF